MRSVSSSSSASCSSAMTNSTSVAVAYTTAYPEAAGTLAPAISLDDAVTDALRAHFDSQPARLPASLSRCGSVAAVFSLLSSSACSHAVTPIENSEMGSFRSVYELIVRHDCYIVGEFAAQCDIPPAASSSASSSLSSTASSPASTLWTRFVIVSLSPAVLPSVSLSFGAHRASLKSSCVLGLNHEAGSVFRILSCFAMRNINVLNLQVRAATPSSFPSLTTHEASPFTVIATHSRLPSSSSSSSSSAPTSPRAAASPFQSSDSGSQTAYLFYLDWVPSNDERTNAALLDNLREFSVSIALLGTYRQNLHVKTQQELIIAC